MSKESATKPIDFEISPVVISIMKNPKLIMSIVHNSFDCTSELSIVTSFSSIELEYVCFAPKFNDSRRDNISSSSRE